MNEDPAPGSQGHLHRITGTDRVASMLDGIGTSNGLGWGPDNRVMYCTDSAVRTIWAFDFNSDGELSNQRPFRTQAKRPQRRKSVCLRSRCAGLARITLHILGTGAALAGLKIRYHRQSIFELPDNG